MRGRVLLLLFLACVVVAALAVPQTMPINVEGPTWGTAVFALAAIGIYLTGTSGFFTALERLANFLDRRQQ